jgi:hypothetical protein
MHIGLVSHRKLVRNLANLRKNISMESSEKLGISKFDADS